jgi:flagellar hook-associated protein 2
MAIDNSPLLSLIGPSGLDTGAIIDALASVRRNPIRRLEAQRAKLQKQNTEFGTLRTRLDALRAKAASLDAGSELRAFSASSSNATALTALTTSGASEGTYTITVDSLAEAESKLSSGVSARTGVAIGSGTITITANGTAHHVTIAAGSDLEGIRDAINSSGAPVTATIIDDGSGTDPFKLILTSESTGTAGAFSVDLAAFTPQVPSFLFSALATGQDASITLNGTTIVRGSNTLTDVLDGVTLTLLAEGQSSTVTITKDRAAVKSKIQELVAAFNDVFDLFKAHASAELKDTTAVLYGDATLRGAKSAIESVVRRTVTGTGSSYDTLESVGIRIGADGRLAVDESKLTDALTADFDGVIALFTATGAGIASHAQSVSLGFQASSLKARTDGIQTRLRGIVRQLDQLEEGLERYIESLRKKYAALDGIVGRLQTQAGALGALRL